MELIQIKTPRLTLLCATEEMIKAELKSAKHLSDFLSLEIDESWPPEFNDAQALKFLQLQLEKGKEQYGWWMYYIILTDEQSEAVIGTCGFKGLPDSVGCVEIGYSLLKKYQNQGYGTEAVKGLVDWAFSQSKVKLVKANTLPQLKASIQVLKKNGFLFMGEGEEIGTLQFVKLKEE